MACKSIAKHGLLTHQELSLEIQIMQRLAGHPNVVQLRSVHEDQQSVHLVVDLCQGGELIDRILQRKQFEESDAATTMRTILEVSSAQYCTQLLDALCVPALQPVPCAAGCGALPHNGVVQGHQPGTICVTGPHTCALTVLAIPFI
jgi:serine/threonine protein kinase